VFRIEKSAPKEGYHDVPDVDRKVITRVENKQLFGKLPETLATTLDVEAARAMCQDACGWLGLPSSGAAKGKNACEIGARPRVDVRVTDNVGTYVCGFQYYMSLLGMEKATGRRNVAFLHVPRLESEAEVKVGLRVVEELIEALVGGMKV
jgi:pyroglutamyl-peptidase